VSGAAPVVVVGAGAAGLLAALSAARAGAPVVLIERTKDGGRKILISGGGRCNILPARAAPERFVTASSPHSLRNILAATRRPAPSSRRADNRSLETRWCGSPASERARTCGTRW
jgi:2-polyprenyl-6-methoxyphenol hydroxylase-like FAD-dependent oxidoreductase